MNIEIKPTFGGILGIAAVCAGAYMAYKAVVAVNQAEEGAKAKLEAFMQGVADAAQTVADIPANVVNYTKKKAQAAVVAVEAEVQDRGTAAQHRYDVDPVTGTYENPMVSPDGMDFSQVSG